MSGFSATFAADGIPKAQPRARAGTRRRGHKVFAHVYSDTGADGWKAIVRHAGRMLRPAAPLTGPLSVELAFYFPRPKDHFRTGRFADQLKPSAPAHQTQKPDNDNLEKAVYDALTNDGWWKDDAQIVENSTRKTWCKPGVRPGCTVTVTEIDS